MEREARQPPGFAPALMAAVRSASVGVIVAVPAEGGYRCEFANERVLSLLGRIPRHIPDDLDFTPADRSKVADWLVAPGSEPLMLEAAKLSALRDRGSVRVVASRADVGGRQAIVVFVYDVDVRRRAERALAESENRFRRLLDAAPDAIALGTRANFFYANPALVRLLGYSRMEEVTEKPLRDHLHPDDRGRARDIASALATGRNVLPRISRIRARRKDGGYVQTDARIISIEWDGEPALLGIARDLTERRRVQAQLIRADRLAAMGTLAAGVAHEINNPLAYLMLNLQYLLRELPRFDGDPARLELLLERLAEAKHGARRVSTIVGDLRAFSRPEQLERGPVSVRRAVEAAVKVTGPQIKHRARLVEDYEPAPLVDGSATRLEQVFVNLLVNAIQAIPDGNAAKNEVRVRIRHSGGKVVVEVSDTGVGIPPETLGRVFDPFFTTKPRGVGTGLGLPISRGIVTSLAGDIGVESTAGVGTTFRVSLPALPAEDLASTPQASVPEAPRVARSRLLVVDDEPLVADMLQRALSDDHDVTVTTDARTALEYILSGSWFDLIFCDLLMPRMTGMALYAELRAQAPEMAERVIFMTGGAFTERAAQFLASVPNPKLTKPFDLNELERVLAEALSRPP